MARKKLGNVSIIVLVVFAIIVILILFVFAISYVQITSTVLNIKNDLYNVAQNGIVANNKEELAFNNYIEDKEQMKKYIQEILQKNYIRSNGYINGILLEECSVIKNKNDVLKHTSNRYDETIIHLKIKIIFTPIIKIKGIGKNISINIHEDVKSSLLQYGGI